MFASYTREWWSRMFYANGLLAGVVGLLVPLAQALKLAEEDRKREDEAKSKDD